MQTFMLPKMPAFKSFNTNKILSSKPHQIQLFDDLKNSANKATQQYQHQSIVENYETRSIKVYCEPLDISFQSNFMEQHKLSFKKQSQKYLDFQQKLLQLNQKNILNKKLVHQQTSLNGQFQIDKILRNSSNNLLSNQQSQRLIIDLRREDKLHDFMELVMVKLQEQAKIQFIFIANELWQQFILIQQIFFDFQQTKQFAQNFTNKSIQKIDQKLNYINFKYFHIEAQNTLESGIKGQRFKHFKNFLLYLNTTFALLIGGFFENPYFKQQSNYFKRQHKQGFNFGSLSNDFNNPKDYDDQQDEDNDQHDIFIKKKVKY